MPFEIPESDWKIFRKLRKAALERFCKRVMEELVSICTNEYLTSHERYLAAWKLLKKRDKEVSLMFDDLRRSTMLQQLQNITVSGLLTHEEIREFNEDIQKLICSRNSQE